MPCLTGLEGIPDTRTTKERKAMEAEREREDKKWRKEEQRRLQMIKDELDNAKRFYYQRKTCFRGMLRYNQKGTIW